MNEATGHTWVIFDGSEHPNSINTAIGRRVAENEPVLIVNRAVSVLRERKLPAFRKRCKHSCDMRNLWFYRPLHYPERLFGLGQMLRVLNRYSLQCGANRLLPKEKKKIVWYDSPKWHHVVGKLREFISVYFATDDFTVTITGEPIKGEIEAERKLLSKIDLVICVSETLAQRLREREPFPGRPNIRVLPNCFDERIFDADRIWLEPAELESIARPRVLVAGYVSERIDWDGLAIASRLRPNWNWVFRGPADKGMQEKLVSTLGARGFYFPPVSLKDMPAWIKYSDGCAVPYRLNSFTLASSPAKAYEYLAMGAPVLSTRVPSLGVFDGVIEWVFEGDGLSYARALDSIEKISRNDALTAIRRSSVAGDSLGLRVEKVRQIIQNFIKESGGCIPNPLR